MPSLHPCDERTANLSSFITDQLAAIEYSLAEGCERITQEREAGLREENKQLQQEVEDLRLRLDRACANSSNDNTAIVACKQAEPPISVVPLKATEVLALPNTGNNSDDEESITVNFKLLPEYVEAFWQQADGVTEHDAGYFHREEPTIEVPDVKSFIVDPSSERRLVWDILGIPILSWDLITIPLGVFSIGPTGNEIMGGAGWVTLIYWTIDLPCTFLTGYFDDEGTLVMDLRKIARNYVHAFFGLDVLIIVADWTSVILENLGSAAPPALSNMSILRVFRITRFVRLLRLRKLKAKVQALEDGISSEWWLVIMNLFGKVFSIVMVNHYICCIWYWIGSVKIPALFGDIPTRRWLTAIPYPQYDSEGHKLDEAEWAYQYWTCLHWAIAQFTPGPQNIQPQNAAERIFAIFVLLFGMVVFSSFIAGVTQARMQLSKMMSKLDRDLWLLRKFCQQHSVSRELTARMKRYIDLVIVPNYHKLSIVDVILIPKLSVHLRSQLNNELVSHVLCIHPFFGHLRKYHDAVMNVVSNNCIDNLSLARGDVVFGSGQVARYLLLVSDGVLDYIPVVTDTEEHVVKGRWVAEAVLWTKWVHQGQMQASIEARAMLVDSAKLRGELIKNGLVMGFVRKYGSAFVERLNQMAEATGGQPSDLHDNISADIPIGTQLTQVMFLWQDKGSPSARKK